MTEEIKFEELDQISGGSFLEEYYGNEFKGPITTDPEPDLGSADGLRSDQFN